MTGKETTTSQLSWYLIATDPNAQDLEPVKYALENKKGNNDPVQREIIVPNTLGMPH